ncbi:MAG: hypothetical protein A2032_01400 [Chloroflexi bacterium RBG_19FT_COMBO_49_13]|nr:MAG: hypothetical protein A2032_01400 [Chloroflexi bacterium RBG_19FT_COMBO_49_13]
MRPEQAIEKYLQFIQPGLRDIVLEIRNIVTSVSPHATESQHSRGFSYYHKQRGGPVSAGICEIGIFRDHVRLGFVHGAFLPDPQGLLVGEPKYKKHLRIYNYDEAPWEYMKELIVASSRFDPYTLMERKE